MAIYGKTEKPKKTRKQKWEEKQLYGHFLKKDNLKRESEFLLIAAYNNHLTVNYISMKIDNTQ